MWVVDSLYFGRFLAVFKVGFRDGVSPLQLTRKSAEGLLGFCKLEMATLWWSGRIAGTG